MRRRDFILTAAALGAAGAGIFAAGQRLSASVHYPGRDIGHRLRDALPLVEPTETIETNVLIAGSGVAALTAAWQLHKRGVRDMLLVTGPERHGNAAGGRFQGISFPTGAHYLPLPSLESRHVREMLADFDIIQRDPYGDRPTYDERFLVHGPAERVLYRGAWQDGYLPSDGVSAFERGEHARFFGMVEGFSRARGSDGRRVFAVPLQLSSADPRYRELDRVSFRAWLEGSDFRAPTLLWYLDYCCRDDYGRHLDEISAWAGLHYFCSRDGQAANAGRGAVLTWPDGLSTLVSLLDEASQAGTHQLEASVRHLAVNGDRVKALLTMNDASGRSVRVLARRAIAAMPLYVLQNVLGEAARFEFDARRDVPRYAPWLVSNFVMKSFPQEKSGAPLSWDNVVYRETGLGYVVSTHQDIRLSRPERTAFTAYHALSDVEPAPGRHWLDTASVPQLTEMAARDLKLAYGWRLPPCVEHVDITVRAHAMAIPEPGFLSSAGRAALCRTTGPLWFAHSDLSGLSLFEEAAWWGYQAAARIAPG